MAYHNELASIREKDFFANNFGNFMTNNLIVFATYWNEIDFILPSLAQIDQLKPTEIIICDGCFDPSVPNYSTDGTRQVIEDYIASRPHARMISAVREPKARAIRILMKGHNKSSLFRAFTPGRLKTILLSMRLVPYRLNQAITFQKMISLSECWQPGSWFMTLDCDQFYSDQMIESFGVVNHDTPYGLLVGKEKTFFSDFSKYTDEYEGRSYNNMPHKIFHGTTIIPTRGIIIENWSFTSFNLKKILLGEFYINKVSTLDVGNYFHYKFKLSVERFDSGYKVGDRVKPNFESYNYKINSSGHPKNVRDFFSL